MKTLISWIAANNDFKDGAVDEYGPTFNFYKNFFAYDRHLLLSSAVSDDTKAEHLLNALKRAYPEKTRATVLQYLAISDVIDIGQIKEKVETLLLQYPQDEIDIFYSPGTSAMQVAWYICHTTLQLQTRLLQVRPASKTQSKKPELVVIDVGYSSQPVSAVIREENLSTPESAKRQPTMVSSVKKVYERAELIARTDKVTTLIYGEAVPAKSNWHALYTTNRPAAHFLSCL